MANVRDQFRERVRLAAEHRNQQASSITLPERLVAAKPWRPPRSTRGNSAPPRRYCSARCRHLATRPRPGSNLDRRRELRGCPLLPEVAPSLRRNRPRRSRSHAPRRAAPTPCRSGSSRPRTARLSPRRKAPLRSPTSSRSLLRIRISRSRGPCTTRGRPRCRSTSSTSAWTRTARPTGARASCRRAARRP